MIQEYPSSQKILKYNGLSTIQMAILDNCNFQCIHCYNGYSDNPQVVSFDKIKDIIKEASDFGCINFDITGGEPFLHPDIFSILEEINLNNMITRIYTNGSLLSEKIVEKISDYNIDEIRVSIDSIDEDTFVVIRKNTELEKIKRNILLLRDFGIRVGINTTVMKQNLKVIKKISDFAKKYGCKHYTDTVEDYSQNQCLRITPKEFAESIEYRIYESSVRLNADKCCEIFGNYLFVDSQLGIKPCPTFPNKYNLGYYPSITIKDAFLINSKKHFQCFAKKNCKFGKLCNGGCRSRAFHNEGNPNGKDIYFCELYKSYYNK